jgi:hypothetical protein
MAGTVVNFACVLIGCENAAITIYRGYALCPRCWKVTDEIPDHVPAHLIESIIRGVIDTEYTLENSMLRFGYARPRDLPWVGTKHEHEELGNENGA